MFILLVFWESLHAFHERALEKQFNLRHRWLWHMRENGRQVRAPGNAPEEMCLGRWKVYEFQALP